MNPKYIKPAFMVAASLHAALLQQNQNTASIIKAQYTNWLQEAISLENMSPDFITEKSMSSVFKELGNSVRPNIIRTRVMNTKTNNIDNHECLSFNTPVVNDEFSELSCTVIFNIISPDEAIFELRIVYAPHNSINGTPQNVFSITRKFAAINHKNPLDGKVSKLICWETQQISIARNRHYEVMTSFLKKFFAVAKINSLFTKDIVPSEQYVGTNDCFPVQPVSIFASI